MSEVVTEVVAILSLGIGIFLLWFAGSISDAVKVNQKKILSILRHLGAEDIRELERRTFNADHSALLTRVQQLGAKIEPMYEEISRLRQEKEKLAEGVAKFYSVIDQYKEAEKAYEQRIKDITAIAASLFQTAIELSPSADPKVEQVSQVIQDTTWREKARANLDKILAEKESTADGDFIPYSTAVRAMQEALQVLEDTLREQKANKKE